MVVNKHGHHYSVNFSLYLHIYPLYLSPYLISPYLFTLSYLLVKMEVILVMYEFCNNNALYSVIPSITMFFSFNSFRYLGLLLFQIRSQPSVVLQSSKHDKITFSHSLFLCLSQYGQKKCQTWRLAKK